MGSSLERGSRFKVLGSKVQGFRVQRLNSEPQNIEGWFRFAQSFL